MFTQPEKLCVLPLILILNLLPGPLNHKKKKEKYCLLELKPWAFTPISMHYTIISKSPSSASRLLGKCECSSGTKLKALFYKRGGQRAGWEWSSHQKSTGVETWSHSEPFEIPSSVQYPKTLNKSQDQQEKGKKRKTYPALNCNFY